MIFPVASILFLCVVWTIGIDFGLHHTTPKVVTQTKYVNRYVEKPVYIGVEKPTPVDRPVYIEVEKPITIEREVKVLVEVPVMLKDWDSLEQLKEFLRNDNTDKSVTLTVDSKGELNFNGQCEDYALQLRDRAMAIGMHLSIAALHPKEYEKWYGKQAKPNQYHAIAMARIGNELWYIEPQTDEHWLALYLD